MTLRKRQAQNSESFQVLLEILEASKPFVRNNRKGGTAQGGYARGRASGAMARSGHVLRVTGLDISRIRITARLRCVWKEFPRGTPLCVLPAPLRLFQYMSPGFAARKCRLICLELNCLQQFKALCDILWKYPCRQNDHMQILFFWKLISENCNYNYMFQSPGELILQSCDTPCRKPSAYNYIW